jgi:hypothetical protein
MRAEAAQGRMPYDAGRLHAAAQPGGPARSFGVSGALRACQEVGIAVPAGNRFTLEQLDAALNVAIPFNQSPTALQRRMELKAKLAAAGILIEQPLVDEKRVLHAVKLLKAAGMRVPTDYVYTLDEINAELAKTSLDPGARIALKTHCVAAGLLDEGDGAVPQQAPNSQALRMSRSILSQIGLDEPPAGKRLNLATVNAAIDKAGLKSRSISIKSTLAAAGFLD